jgi:membrane-bound lytic murein transglycosylase B
VCRALAPLIVTLALLGCGGEHGASPKPPAAGERPAGETAGTRPGLAGALTAAHAQARHAIAAWLRDGDPAREPAPAAVADPAQRAQAVYARLAARPRLARQVLARLDGRVRVEARDIVAAQRAIRELNAPFANEEHRFEVGEPEPAGALLGYFGEAGRRSHVDWELLAAVNLVESAFGRLRNDSVAGAQGPMQFTPPTWEGYGRGDIHDPHDSILAAGRLLHAGGAPGDERAALYRYNPSQLYVTAVAHYARVMRRDPRAFYALYAWRAPVPDTTER